MHALLSAAGESGPYVLVGHSYGGLIVRLYASTYPKEVSGLVLVDALSEGLQDAETREQWAKQRKLIEGDVRESVALYPAPRRKKRTNVSPSLCRMKSTLPTRIAVTKYTRNSRSW